ncbi:DnaJ domain protein [Aspergillus candidus]|uniref:J domain-containing protein n=1 Tax=Aspergillus candidus TaxID=41067 RepID=A0A2I2F9S1_ASPCN|nr:hypothetical protein BDW47DRAFT_132040 [Aspergillus candidus]PLB37369.1 hypothetical protein BDW47DRAFT_132040 [Aspergillus candidus]
MVKTDVRRDYYADLGLTPSAESEDIKRQFRKLALKYHPDRNPGKEVDFISKFQSIQAANEILSDPQQRLRYDTDRLRAGYGKFYGPPKTKPPPRRTPTAAPTAKSTPPKPNFASRPQSFQGGPSTGAQRYASYARAAPKQPWERRHDDQQTRADAYRGFQDMKGSGMPGWTQFDPHTGRSGQHPGGVPRPSANSSQSARPKSAYEYFKTSPKPASTESPRASASFAKKKSGFAPRAATGGDEPMASNTSAYSNVPRAERAQASKPFFAPAASSPTARKAAAAAGFQARTEQSRTPDIERTGSKYAGTGGERAFFSSAGMGRSSSVRNSPESAKPQPRTTPPSPVPPRSGRHRSASPDFNAERSRNYSSTSSSGLDDDDDEDDLEDDLDEMLGRKPKAVPRSRMRPNQKFGNFHVPNQWSYRGGHDSDSAASPSHRFASTSFPKAGNLFDPTHAFTNNSHHGTFKSTSHDDLRRPFSAAHWGGTSFFTGTSSENGETPSHNRGRPASRRGGYSSSASNNNSPRPETASQQPPTSFPSGQFFTEDWVEKLKNMSWDVPESSSSQQPPAASQRQRSPRKHTRPPVKARPVPQQASVATEAEEAQATVNGDQPPEPAPAPAPTANGDAEAMDVDDELPARSTKPTTPEPASAPKGPPKEAPVPKTPPTANKGTNSTNRAQPNHLFNLTNLSNTVPFTNTTGSGIDDLQDIFATLPFESRAKVPKTTARDVRPRNLICPNPPKRPQPPAKVPLGLDPQQQGLPRAAWDRYVAEMHAYMRDWNRFQRRILGHFNARQEAIETGMSPNWVSAVGDSTRLGVTGADGDEEAGPDGDDDGAEDDTADEMIAGAGKGGFSAYLRAIEEDAKVQKHWEVAREMHRDCILQLGEMREWIRNGGKLV